MTRPPATGFSSKTQLRLRGDIQKGRAGLLLDQRQLDGRPSFYVKTAIRLRGRPDSGEFAIQSTCVDWSGFQIHNGQSCVRGLG